jgi:Spy/CpxP family protein refolding chaperone
MKNTLLILTALTLVFAAGLINGCRHERHPGAEFVVDYLAESLDANDAQRRHMEQIKSELLAKGKAMQAAHHAAADEFRTLLAADELDQERLKQIVAEHRSRIDELVVLAIGRLAEFHRTLSPEQKAKLIGKLENLRKMHRRRWNPAFEG